MADKVNIRVKLSALWAVLMFLYVYADVLSLFRPGQIDEIRQGMMGPLEVSQTTLLFASVIVIIPALMVFAPLVLKPKPNRWANLILGAVFTLVNIGNLVGESWIYYILFGLLEITVTLLIVRYAWRWREATN